MKCPCIPGSNWNLEMLVFKERGKPEYPEKNLSEQSREPTRSDSIKGKDTPSLKHFVRFFEQRRITPGKANNAGSHNIESVQKLGKETIKIP